MRARSVLVALALLATLPFIPAPAAQADHGGQPALNPSLIDYTPMGYYGPPDEQNLPVGMTGSAQVPLPDGDTPPGPGGIGINDPNPSGKFVAYDRDVWESLSMPYRHPGDTCGEIALPTNDEHPDCRSGDADPDDDTSADTTTNTYTGYTGYTGPHGTFSSAPGTCPPSPETPGPWGQCFNNQLEYLEYYEHEMETEFKDLGLEVSVYGFQSPGAGLPRGSYIAAAGGQAYNITATIPGADHPDETVLVGAHYDFTDSGPAAAWDSAEGHTEIMRMAWIMADYYRQTGTRPSATVKFVPWDSEESGSHGSQNYVDNNIPPDQFHKVRAYFNVDPCAGAYPAFDQDQQRQVNQVMQLANPDAWEDSPEIQARINAFNARAETIIDEVWEYLDDTLTRPTGEVPIFVSEAEETAGTDGTNTVTASDREKVVTAVGGLLLFGSDYSNFEEVGIPIFNFFPDQFGPHADGTPSDGGAKGLEILHTNNDNLQSLNRETQALTTPGNVIDPTGNFASEGWAKGMEMCAQVESWYMLQPEMAGTQVATTQPVAYFEALPNEAIQNQFVNFDATAAYQYSNVATRAMHDDSALTFSWDFGDGTSGAGQVTQHAYREIGVYNAKLTVTGVGGQTDTMEIPIKVIGSNFTGPVLSAVQQEDGKDGNFELNWDFSATRDGFEKFRVEESTDIKSLLADDGENIEVNFAVTPPTTSTGEPQPRIEPWQHSDSDTEKFRGNQRRSGARSYWTGSTPENFAPAPANSQSYMQTKNPIQVPAEGDPELSYWSLFQNENDDRGFLQAAITDGTVPPDQLDWNTIDQVPVTSCGGTNTGTLTQGLTNRRVELGEYRGKQILLRFLYTVGPTDVVSTHPCGWYVDDVSFITGTWKPIGETTEEKLLVLDRQNGLYGYRVKGVYTDGITTRPSNTELVNVTDGKPLPLKQLRRCLRFAGNHILGSVDKDTLVGTEGPDVICGFGGHDKMRALGGKDIVLGFKGKDRINGQAHPDRLFGDEGRDRLRGGKGKDRIKGGKGKDRINGGGGNDRCGSGKKKGRRGGGRKADVVRKC